MRPLVVLFAKQRNQVLREILRVSIQPKTTFHKTGRRCLDCCITLDILAEIFKVAHYPFTFVDWTIPCQWSENSCLE
jgi:hypothetical protein